MYDELIKSLREDHGKQYFARDMEAADAIETLCSAYMECFAVIAKAYRDNPNNLTLREYMMKNACCCEAEEGE